MTFLDELSKDLNKSSYTENGALTNRSTLSALLDFFSRAGAMRGHEEDAVKLFKDAYAEDRQLAVRCLFYLRDVRGGQGERKLFRTIFNEFMKMDEKTALTVVEHIPDYGRWDEVPINNKTVAFIKNQLEQDEALMKSHKSVSLLAKWLPSENTSSKETQKDANKLMSLLELKPRQYRKRIVALRQYIKLLEQEMSSKRWQNIDYSSLPSQAFRKHTKAFMRHDKKRYEDFIGKVEKGEAKINTNTVFTYEVYDMIHKNGYFTDDETVIRTADAIWKNLPDYTNDTNALVLADVSGSMQMDSGRPMSISTSLALYFAERNKGLFKNTYMTFTNIPHLMRVGGGNIKDKLEFIETTDVGYNTNLLAAFVAILKAAINSKAKQEELPSVLYIISDMEFDAQMSNCDETNFETAKRMFEDQGYKLPHVVFWNVNARNNQSPATMYDDMVTLISGSSQSTFKYVVAGKSPMESMLEILNSERYSKIKI